jgi:flagellar biosynthetic protein FliR
MNDMPNLLAQLPDMTFAFILVLARTGSALLIGPVLGDAEIPPTVRIALAVLISALVYPMLRVHLPALPSEVPALISLIGVEIAVGAWLGFMTTVLVGALSLAGGIISFMVGLTSVLQIDPDLGTQVPALQRMLALAALALLFASGLYLLPLQAVIGSYEVIPPGGGFDTGGAAQLVTHAVSDSFGLALRLAAPFVITCMIWQTVLGFISRMVPHIQVHVVSAPAQIVGGLALLSVSIMILFATWETGMQKALSALPGL